MKPDPSPEIRKETRRLVMGACLVAVVVALIYFTPLKAWARELLDLKASVRGFGWRAHAIFIIGSVAGIAIGVPRLLLCAVGGFLFGFWEGLLVSQFASVLGSYGAFLLTRTWAPKAWVQAKLANSERLRAVLEKPDIASIFIARQLPVPGIVPNVLLGVLNVSHLTFLMGTFIGYLPSNIPVALITSSVGKDDVFQAVSRVSGGMVALGLFSALILWIRRRTGASEDDQK